ncbi:MAG: hypothetical protein Q7W30_01870 [Coriobacteriia bacterium]|nr:hypothetical protein [Coriobacteriia bacterium]
MRLVLVWLAGLGLLGALLLSGTSLPSACGSCHAMERYAEALKASRAHSAVHCYACHQERGAWGFAAQKSGEWFRMYPAALLGRAELTGAGTRVQRGECVACHRALLGGRPTSGRIRILHRACADGQSCDACHSDVAHGTATRSIRSSDMDECVACHRRATGPVACDACHAPRTSRQRLRVRRWASTHTPSWPVAHGAGDVLFCGTCHAPGDCARCHATQIPHARGFALAHGGDAKATGSKCLTCHESAYCDGCHGVAMPHPVGYVERHAATVTRTDDPACRRCHAIADCVACHEKNAVPSAGAP